MSSHLWRVHTHYSPQLVERWTYVSSLLLSHTPHRSRTDTAGWGAWRMLWRVRERSRPSSPSQLWVAGLLSPNDVFIYLFCTKLLLCSKDVTFDPVPWFIICVRLGPSTPGDYVRAWVLVPRNPSVTIKLRPGGWLAREESLSVVSPSESIKDRARCGPDDRGPF
jgi:hypothetical protein